MPEIIVGNSYSRIIGLDVKTHMALAKELSYTIGGQASYFNRFGTRRRSLLSKRGEFPTGLLDRVTKFIPIIKVTYIKEVVNKVHYGAKWNGFIPYPDQIQAVVNALKAKRGTIAMPTGTGKSMVIAMLINELKLKTLVVVPSLEIKQQLTNTIHEVFGYTEHITIENIDSKNLKETHNYDCLIIDEAHHVAAKTYQTLNKKYWTNIQYRFFMTATPFRNDKEEQLLFEGIAGQVIFNLTYKDAIKKGYIVPIEAYYIELPKRDVDGYTYAEVYKELIVDNPYRNFTISSLLVKLANNFTLCLVKEIGHGKLLQSTSTMPFVNGQDAESRHLIEEFKRGTIKPRSLIGTEGILGEGVDTKPCEFVIIAGLGKAKSAFMQKVGRAVRKYPGKETAKVIIFKDPSHKFTVRHFNEQVKILKSEYGVNPIKLNL